MYHRDSLDTLRLQRGVEHLHKLGAPRHSRGLRRTRRPNRRLACPAGDPQRIRAAADPSDDPGCAGRPLSAPRAAAGGAISAPVANAALEAGVRRVSAEATGAVDVIVVRQIDAIGLLGDARAGDMEAAGLLQATSQAVARVQSAPRRSPMLCTSCPAPAEGRCLHHRSGDTGAHEPGQRAWAGDLPSMRTGAGRD